MIRVALGGNRVVFVGSRYAVKLPRPWPLQRLRDGLQGNQMEADVWREGWAELCPELCPVVGMLPFGVALIMPAVKIMSDDELKVFRESDKFPDHHPDPELYEDKPGEWGLLDGRPVIVDYDNRIYLDPDRINPLVRTLKDARDSWVPPLPRK